MKKYLVIGNPIEHSWSPKLHNYWFKEKKIDAIYEKKQIKENAIEGMIGELKNGKIKGINVTVPFKKSVIPFLDELTPIAKETQSVNTIFRSENGDVVGENTDVHGFIKAIKNINYDVKNKIAFILGAGGVVPSIICALKSMGISKICLSNRTKKRAEEIKKIYSDLNLVEWGATPSFDIIINATSLGLKESDEIKLNYNDSGPKKLFYDVIYNPNRTNFLLNAKKFGSQTENGRLMFIYQAQQAFKIWHSVEPEVNEKVLKILDND